MVSVCAEHSQSLVASRPRFELADILRRYLPDYRKTHRLSLWQQKILYAIQICRTAACGGHLEVCDQCQFQRPAYDSCHNRHCPKCLGIARRRWVAARLNELLPVPYYHVVFTLPHRLNTLALYNKRLLYNLFYRAAAYTLLKFGKDPKFLGAQLGFIGVLHTWGKGLIQHIHWHFIVPGGGLTKDRRWTPLPCKDRFLFPVQAMSKVIKGRFIKGLKTAYQKEQLIIPDRHAELNNPRMFEYFLNDLASDPWVNYAKRPFGSPEQVVKYIGRYTHRVALSNQRILDIEDGKIRLQVKEYKKEGRLEEMTLSAEEFIRRFLLHILPKRFRKIRYGGFLATPVREDNLATLQDALPGPDRDDLLPKTDSEISPEEGEILKEQTCPKCQIGTMRTIEVPAQPVRYDRVSYQDSS